MSCIICLRGSCCSSFHRIEEQQAFDPAEEAYQVFLAVRENCARDYAEACEQDDEDE